MKTILALCIASLVFSSVTKADQSLEFPKKNPLISFTVPDDWKPQMKNGSLFVLPAKGDNLIVEVMMMEAAKDDADAAVKEAKATVDEFKHLVFSEPRKNNGHGLEATILEATGEDANGKANISLMILGHPKSDKMILVSMIASLDVSEKDGLGAFGIMASLGAKGFSADAPAPAGAAKPAPAATAAFSGPTQSFNYPNDDNREFSISFPADWKFEQDAVSGYVVTPDKLVATNILMIDQGEVGVAMEKLKKQTSEKYTSVEWSDDQVNKDDALGLTATFEHGSAEDAKGNKYSINFAQFVRKSGDKFMMLICQHPLSAAKVHGDNLEAMLQSIKVKK